MRHIVVNSLICGLRARSLQAVAVLGVLLVGVALLAASFSARQPQTVAIDIGFSGAYFTLILLGLFLTQELVVKEIDRRTVFFVLSYPVPRHTYLLGRYFGIVALLGLATLILGLLLSLAVLASGGGYEQQFPVLLGLPYCAAMVGVWLDASIVTAFCLLISVISTVSIMPMALGAAFAIGGRSIGVVMDYLASGADGDKALAAAYKPILDFIQWVLPDLSRLDWRAWPMYSTPPSSMAMLLAVLMAVGYIMLMMALACRVFSRREFM